MVLRLQTLAAPSPLCHTFERLSSEVWATLADAAHFNLSFGEESLTDHVLLELKRQHPNEIVIRPYNRWHEARNGADWAWWFQGRRGWLGMRVQAKKLYPSRCYEALRHRVGKSKKLQADVLLAQAKKDKLFPMYCFYNFWDVAAYPLSNVPFNCRTFVRREQHMGCTLASAADVKRLAIKLGKDDLATVARVAFPWLCLPCCPQGNGPGDLAQRVMKALTFQLESVEEPEPHPPPQPPPGGVRAETEERTRRRRRRKREMPVLVEEPPRYVLTVKEGRPVDDQELPAGVGGIVVFKDVPREPGRTEERLPER